ncbi:hypothetical protein [Streptomyces sp. NPDC051994]
MSKLFIEYRKEWLAGVRQEKYDYPARYRAALAVCVVTMDLLAFFLTR